MPSVSTGGRPLRLGLVGCGRMGRAHLASIGELPEVQVAAVVDPVGDLSPYRRTTFPRLVASPDIDAVLIASPTVSHEELVRAALENDKHVLCEKPLTLNPKSDRDLGRLAAERGLVLQVGFWRRFAKPYLKMREILASGAIGVPTAVRMAQWDARPPHADFCDPGKSGGLEVDCGIHEFDLVRWLTGSRVEAITGCSPTVSSILGHIGDIDTVIGVARLSGGRSMAIDLTRTAGGEDSIRTEII